LTRLPQASKVSGNIKLLNQKKARSQDEIKFRFLFESANDAILIMKERVEQVKGEFTLETRVGGGVHLLARIPLAS